jgi:hypothetical protein
VDLVSTHEKLLAVKKGFLLFKGTGSLTKIIKSAELYLKAYRLMPLTPPSFVILHYLKIERPTSFAGYICNILKQFRQVIELTKMI